MCRSDGINASVCTRSVCGQLHYKTDYESAEARNSDPRMYHAIQSSHNETDK